MIKIRFRNLPKDKVWNCFSELIYLATGESVLVVEDPDQHVDFEITGPYGDIFNDRKKISQKRIKRMLYSKFTKGQHLVIKNLSIEGPTNNKSTKNFWFTGENTRPPFGNWDLSFGFDTNLSSNGHIYFPLWWVTSTNLFKAVDKSYWGMPIPDIKQMMQPRLLRKTNERFASTFIGKSYSMRLHALNVLNRIEKVDIYGGAARRIIDSPGKIGADYKFILCFENDLYPGYITEKPFEAYFAGAIPLYHGLDSAGYLNPKATINLNDFQNIDGWGTFIEEVHRNTQLYKEIFEQPILAKEPSLELAISKIRNLLLSNE